MKEINQIANDKWQLDKKPSITEVDKLAKDLCVEYDNFAFFRWYCLVINILGLERIHTIRARCSDAPNKGHLFSSIASQEAKKKVGIEQYQRLKSQYGAP